MITDAGFDARILVIGCGSIGRRHARILKEIGASNLALCDPVQSARQSLQDDLDIGEGYADLEEALRHNFDAVFVCTPPALHIHQATLAIEAGCDVFTEKPLSDRLDGVDELIALAERQKRILMVGLCFRFHKGLLKVKEMIDSGTIGRLVSVRASMAEYLPDTTPVADYGSLYTAKSRIGVVRDYVHEIDLVQWIVAAQAHQVFGFAGKLSELKIAANDTAEILFTYDNGVLASVHLDVFQRTRRRQSEFMGTDGTIVIDFADWDQCSIQTYRAKTGGWERETLPTDRDDMFRAEDRAFLHALATRQKPALDGLEGKKSLQIALAAMASSDRGELIEL
jgi:predicted dehydrogenase